MRDSNLISSEGRGPLTWSEKEALRVQHGNRTSATYAENEAANRRAIEVDMAKKFAPRTTWDALSDAEKFPHRETGKFR
jgi:hypothetical protein